MNDTSSEENPVAKRNSSSPAEPNPDADARSVWQPTEGSAKSPKECPHCGRPIAHPDDLKENDEIDVSSIFEAYRNHRKAHYKWGDNPRNDSSRYGDPYLGNYYKNNRNATTNSHKDLEDLQCGLDIVGQVFDVTIYYEAKKEARVVASTPQQAIEKVKYDELPDGVDLTGEHPDERVTHQTHEETTHVKNVERRDTELVERMEG